MFCYENVTVGLNGVSHPYRVRVILLAPLGDRRRGFLCHKPGSQHSGSTRSMYMLL